MGSNGIDSGVRAILLDRSRFRFPLGSSSTDLTSSLALPDISALAHVTKLISVRIVFSSPLSISWISYGSTHFPVV